MQLSTEQIQLIKDTIAKGATDTELAMFLQLCQRLGLDPFSRQMFLVDRWDSQLKRVIKQPMVSIDGMRVVAQRTGNYRGQTTPEWCGPDGAWKEVWLENAPPAAARIGVYHADFETPLYAIARYSAYVQTKKNGEPNHMWKKMPDNQLLKCAESLALRKAFPHDLAGVYSTDEMDQASNNQTAQAQAKANKKTKTLHDAVIQSLPEPAEPAEPAEPEKTEQPTQTIAEEFIRLIGKCKTNEELDALCEKIPKEDMTYAEVTQARIAYSKAKFALSQAQ
jgi:phage recombination protein Bet